MGRSHDTRTLDLFAVPQPVAPVPASMDYRATIAHLLSDMLKQTNGDRYAIAASISRLTGKEVTKAMLDAYTSEAREAWNIPFWIVAATEAACESHTLTNWLSGVRGGQLLVGRETLNAELGKLEKLKDEAARKIRELKKMMGETR